MPVKPLFFVSFTIYLFAGHAQTFMTRNMLWLSANVNYQFRKQWTSVSDLQYRMEYTDGDIYQVAARSGISYKTVTGYQVVAGGAFFLHYPNPNGRVPRR